MAELQQNVEDPVVEAVEVKQEKEEHIDGNLEQDEPPAWLYKRKKLKGNFNPCSCFTRFCGSYFTLSVGCYLIGVALFISGLIYNLTWLTTTDRNVKILEKKAAGKSYQDYITISAFVFRHTTFKILALISGTVYGMMAGTAIILGSWKHERMYCCAFIGLTGLGILWNLVTNAIEAEVVYGAKLKLLDPKGSKRDYIIYTWTSTAISTTIELYFLVCGISLWKHLTDEEHYEQDNKVFPFVDDDDPRNFLDGRLRSFDNVEDAPDGIL